MNKTDIVNVVTILALLGGPIIAVQITLWSQKRAAKRTAKERVFLELMAHRKIVPPPQGWADSLNIIDVIYDDEPKVLECWRQCYNWLSDPNQVLPSQNWDHLYLDLLSEMAECLRYKHLKQTTIDKFYLPQVHGNFRELQSSLLLELLRVLKDGFRK